MCGIWDWQSTIVKDLNDSQDPKHTLFCRKIVFVAIYALFFRQQMSAFTRLGGGSHKADIVRFFYRFSYKMASLRQNKSKSKRKVRVKAEAKVNKQEYFDVCECHQNEESHSGEAHPSD